MNNLTNRVLFLNSKDGDWKALYIGGQKVIEGRTLKPEDVAWAITKLKPISKTISVEDLRQYSFPEQVDTFNPDKDPILSRIKD